MADDLVFSASLDDSEVLKALRRLDKEAENLAKDANDAFNKIEKESSTSAVAIGAVAGVVTSLTTTFINLGQQAIQSIKSIISESIDLAETQRQAEAQIEQGIRSTGGAAGLTAQQIKDLASSLQNVTNFGDETILTAQGILLTFTRIGQEAFPRASEAILDLAVKMQTDLNSAAKQLGKALNDPESGLDGLSRAGVQFTDSQKEVVKSLIETGDTAGAQALILDELQTQIGGAARAAREASSGIDPLTNAIGDFQEKIGDPIIDTLSDNIEKFLDLIANNQDELDNFVTQLGKLAANAIELVSSNLFQIVEDIDSESIASLAESIERTNSAFSDFGQQLADPTSDINEFIRFVSILNDLLTIQTNRFNNLNTELQKLGEFGAEVSKTLQFIRDDFIQLLTPAGAVNAVLGEISDRLGISNQALSDITSTIAETSKTTAQLAEEQAKLQEGKKTGDRPGKPFEIIDTEQLEEENEELEKALDKLNDLERDAQRKRIDIIRKAGQDRLDAEEDFIQKRIDNARDFLRQIEDIERKNAQAITDSGTDLRRDEEDTYIDFNRKRAELEKDSAKERIKIEEDYREEIRKIQTNFEDSADEAARNRDAVTFLRLQRERDRQIDEAKITRTKRVDEAKIEAQQRRDELNLSLQQQLEDARLADSRRLEDLQIRLDREYEEARLNNERELQDTFLNEERKRQELAMSLERQLQDARIANDRRLSDFKDTLSAEIKALIEAEQKKTAIIQEQIKKRSDLDKQYQSTIERFQETGRTSRLGGRQSGGMIGAGQSRIVGERGPEIFTPTVQGTISPSITNFIRQPNITSSVINNISPTINQSMADQSAITRAIARNEAIATIQGILGNV